MLMIGVTPLPALMNSSFSGGGSGSTNSPSMLLSETIVPGLALRYEIRRDHALVDSLGGDADQPVLAIGSEVSEYARQWRTPLMSIPIRTYCPGL